MFNYEERRFNIPDLKGISEKQLTVHLGLYAGYVKHVNLIREKIREFENEDKEKHAYAISELRRRFGFEFDGMRMHEYYFEQFSAQGGPASRSGSEDPSGFRMTGGEAEIGEPGIAPILQNMVSQKYGSWEKFIEHFTAVGMTRGIGWSILYYDPHAKVPHAVWVGDHELGQLAGLPVILAMDMWEHAFMVDYAPSEKKKYIDAFFSNLNWGVIEERSQKVSGS